MCVYASRSLCFMVKLSIVAGILISIVSCTHHQQFTLLQLYRKNNFSGRDFHGEQITVFPLLTRNGTVTNALLRPEELIRVVGKKRRDLPLQLPYEFQERLVRKYGGGALDSAYDCFFSGTVTALQNDSLLWREVHTRFLMIYKLTYGLTAKIDSQKTIRGMRLEGELWECDSMEVVWRMAVDGRSEGVGSSDSKLLFKAMCRILYALPPVTSGYGSDTW
jgi:hypothetical protein